MPIPASKRWVAGQFLLTSQMNRDVSGLLDNIAGRDGIIELQDGLSVDDGSGSNYILLPRRDGVSGLPDLVGGLIYDSDNDDLYVSDGTTYHLIRDEAFNTQNIAGVLGTDDSHVAEGNHTHG